VPGVRPQAARLLQDSAMSAGNARPAAQTSPGSKRELDAQGYNGSYSLPMRSLQVGGVDGHA